MGDKAHRAGSKAGTPAQAARLARSRAVEPAVHLSQDDGSDELQAFRERVAAALRSAPDGWAAGAVAVPLARAQPPHVLI